MGMLLKLAILFGLGIWVVYSPALRSLRGRSPAPASPPKDRKLQPPTRQASASARAHQPAGQAEAIVACARCELHLPAGEALLDAQGLAYCGPAHRRAGPMPPPTPDLG